MDSNMQLFKAERRHKFIMWSVIAVCALFSLINILIAASHGCMGETVSAYLDNHPSLAQLIRSTGLYGFFAERAAAAETMVVSVGLGQLIMIGISILLIYLRSKTTGL